VQCRCNTSCPVYSTLDAAEFTGELGRACGLHERAAARYGVSVLVNVYSCVCVCVCVCVRVVRVVVVHWMIVKRSDVLHFVYIFVDTHITSLVLHVSFVFRSIILDTGF